MQTPYLSLLGCGGHGWQNCSILVETWQNNVYLWYQTVDWGGFTGLWGRYLEDNNSYANTLLHGYKTPVFPWGDINKAIGYFLSQKSETLEKLWIQRQKSESELVEATQVFLNELNVNDADKEAFVAYLKTAYNGLAEYQKKSGYEARNPALAHFFSPWLFSKLQSMEQWNDWWKTNNILPTHIHLCFTHTNRTTLIAIDEHNTPLTGEDIIDDHFCALLPESIALNSIDAHVDANFLSILSQSTVVIPNGSIANWLSLVNDDTVGSILQKKIHSNNETQPTTTFFWVPNLAHSNQEYNTWVYAHYLEKINLPADIILGCEDDLNVAFPDITSVIHTIRLDKGEHFSTPNREDIATVVTNKYL